MKKYSVDIESTTTIDDCRAYSVGIIEIGKEDTFEYYKNMTDFFYEYSGTNCEMYFHNLAWDGEFIQSWLFANGFSWIAGPKLAEPLTFTTMIDPVGNFYMMTIYFEYNKNKKLNSIIVKDSKKVLPFELAEIPGAFGFEEQKIRGYDYDKSRPVGYEINAEEQLYLKHDVLIVAKALDHLFKNGMTRLTTASNAMADFKTDYSKSEYRSLFPSLRAHVDQELRKSYKGGFTYLNPIYASTEVQGVNILDVSSLYPHVMWDKDLPFGTPLVYNGKYREDKAYPLYIQKLFCNFKLREGKIPTIQIKGHKIFTETEYLESSNEIGVELTLTSVDMELFLENYVVYDKEWLGGWKFRSTKQIFKKYVDRWFSIKVLSTEARNDAMRTLAKLMLNSLYGKFAASKHIQIKRPYFDNGLVRYAPEDVDEDAMLYKTIEGEKSYVPVASFITSYAREQTIRASQSVRDYSMNKYGVDGYIYSDTDSVHTTLSIEELSEILVIHETNLGTWKNEGRWNYAKYIRTKSYLLTNDKSYVYREMEDKKEEDNFNKNRIKIVCAGMPRSCYKNVTFDNFKIGTIYEGKQIRHRVKGGVVLVDEPFEILNV